MECPTLGARRGRRIFSVKRASSDEDEARSLDEQCRARNREFHAEGKRRHQVDAPFFFAWASFTSFYLFGA